MLRTIRTNFDRDESRRDRRYPLPLVKVSLAEGDYETGNWSLGGFLLAAGPMLAVGTTVAGSLKMARARSVCPCAAQAWASPKRTSGRSSRRKARRSYQVWAAVKSFA